MGGTTQIYSENFRNMVEDFRAERSAIQDGTGHSYRLEMSHSDSFWFIKVFDGNVRVGYANCTLTDKILTLADLHVATDAPQPRSGFSRLFHRFLSTPRKPVNYRGRGLGTALLRFITQRAVQRGFTQIEGKLSPQDLAANPKLPDWYRRHGFTIKQGEAHGWDQIQLQLRP